MKTINVKVENPYKVLVGPGLLGEAGRLIAEADNRIQKLMIVSDSNVAPLYMSGLRRALEAAGFEVFDFVFVGAHPMAGTKYSGLKHSKSTMFKGAPLVIVPPVFDDMKLIDRVKAAVEPAGFGSFCLSHADKHDEMIAFTSQMAHVVSNAYVKSPTASEHHGFSAGSYKDLTRVAWLNAGMWAELFMENKDNLIREIDSMIGELGKYKAAMEKGDQEKLQALLQEGSDRKAELDG